MKTFKEYLAEAKAKSLKKPSFLQTILPLRGASILLVVIGHVMALMLIAETNLAGDSLRVLSIGPWQIASVWKSVVHELCRASVPMFLFLSGYFFHSIPRTWKAVWGNCKKMLFPFVFYSLLAWGFSWRKGSGGWGVLEFLDLLVSGKTQLGYFFIILIVQFYVLSMWLLPAIAKRPKLTLALAALIQAVPICYDYLCTLWRIGTVAAPAEWMAHLALFPEFLFPRFIFYVALGIWVGQESQKFKEMLASKFAAIIAAASLAAAALILERGLLFGLGYRLPETTAVDATLFSWVDWKASTYLWAVASIFLLFAVFQRFIPAKNFLKSLGKYSFQIFILHGMVLDLVNLVAYKYFAGYPFYGAAGCAAALAAGIGVPVALTKAIQRFAPAPLRTLLLGA
jgi:fucose 4-O-acetylase-like acetyltransferase